MSEVTRQVVAGSDWEYFYSSLDGMLVHRRVTPCIRFADTPLHTWAQRGAGARVRARTQTARSGGERTNHKAKKNNKATAPLLHHQREE